MLYCYFIARSKPELDDLALPSLATAVRYVRHKDLIAAVRPVPAARSTPQLMLEHTAVLSSALKRATVLPLRFGASFRSESAVLHLLASRRAELANALERLEGKAEMVVRVRLASGEDARRRAEEIRELCHPLDASMEVQPAKGGETLLEVVHLIDRGDAHQYRERAGSFAAHVIGPRPPYYFLPKFLRVGAQRERQTKALRSAAAHSAG